MPLDLTKLQNVRPTAGGGVQAACPVCRGEGRDSKGVHLRIWPSSRWSCTVAPGDSAHNAAIWAAAGDSATGDATYTPPPEPQVTLPVTWDPAELDRLVADHTYWTARGVSEEVLAPLRGGVATEGQMKGRYVLPIFDDDGMVSGFAGRATNPSAQIRWKHMGKVSSWVWGGLDEIYETGEAILVEGAGCRLALDTFGHRNSLVLWGVNLSQAILGTLITANPRRIHVATNADENGRQVGQRAAAKIKGTLDRFFDADVTQVCLPAAKDFLEMIYEDQWTDWRARVAGADQEGAVVAAPATDDPTEEPTEGPPDS